MPTLGELAAHLGLPLGEADASLSVDGIAGLGDAGPRDVAFVAEARYLEALATTRAACVLLKPEWAE